MCGRFTRTTTVKEVARLFELPEPPPELAPRYNIAPSQKVPVGALGAAGRKLSMLKWGLVPFWANDPGRGPHPVNLKPSAV